MRVIPVISVKQQGNDWNAQISAGRESCFGSAMCLMVCEPGARQPKFHPHGAGSTHGQLPRRVQNAA